MPRQRNRPPPQSVESVLHPQVDLFCQFAKANGAEAAKLAIQLHESLNDNLRQECERLSRRSKHGPLGQIPAEDLENEAWEIVAKDSAKFDPQSIPTGKDQLRHLIHWMARRAMRSLIARQQKFLRKGARSVEVSCLVGGEPIQPQSLDHGQKHPFDPSSRAREVVGAILARLKPGDRKTLLNVAVRLERVQTRVGKTGALPRLESAPEPPAEHRWQWRLPDGAVASIAATLKIKHEAAKKRIQRAIKKFRECRDIFEALQAQPKSKESKHVP